MSKGNTCGVDILFVQQLLSLQVKFDASLHGTGTVSCPKKQAFEDDPKFMIHDCLVANA